MTRKWRWRPGAQRMIVLSATTVLAVAGILALRGVRGSSPTGAQASSGQGSAQCAGTPQPQAAASLDAGVGASAWPTFQGRADHNLVLPGVTASGQLAASWSFSPKGEIGTAPSIVGGVAYISSLDQCVYALNAATGAEIWSFHMDNESMSQPLVVDGRVFVGTGNKTVVQTSHGLIRGTGSSTVYALNARTGQELWAQNTTGENMPTLLYADATVYAATGGGYLYAMDAATGKVKWTSPIHSVVSMSSPVAWGQTAVVGGADPYAFYGVNLGSGKVAWKLPVSAEGGVDDISAAIANGVAFVQVPEGIYPHDTVVEFAINATTGKNLWQTLLGRGTLPASNKEEAGVATVSGGVVYVGSPALKGLWALNAQTGAPLWAAPTALPAGIRAAPTVVGNDILANGQGYLYVIDRGTGTLLHTIRVGTPVSGTGECASPAPTVVGQTVYFAAGADSALVAEPLPSVLAGEPPAAGGGAQTASSSSTSSTATTAAASQPATATG